MDCSSKHPIRWLLVLLVILLAFEKESSVVEATIETRTPKIRQHNNLRLLLDENNNSNTTAPESSSPPIPSPPSPPPPPPEEAEEEEPSKGKSEPTICHGSPLIIPKTVTSRKYNKGNKLIIAHRGASSHLPEHTLQGYRLAYELGADYIEPDLVATKDGHLIAVHKMDLNLTTNVDEVFGDQNRTKYSKFEKRVGYWSYEFTLEEIKQLKVRQRLPEYRSTSYDGLFEIPTLTEILELQQEWNSQILPSLHSTSSEQFLERVGIYAELKDVSWLKEDTGVDLVDLFFQHQRDNAQLWQDTIGGSNSCRAQKFETEYLVPPLILQSFDPESLDKVYKEWKTRDGSIGKVDANGGGGNTPVPPMVLLVNGKDCTDDELWYTIEERWRDFVNGIGPDKTCLKNRDFLEHSEMLGLAIHPWTIRPESEYRDDDLYSSALEEMSDMFCNYHQVTGVFTEDISDAILAATLTSQSNKEYCAEIESKLKQHNHDHNHSDNGGRQHNHQSTTKESKSKLSLEVILLLMLPLSIIGCAVYLVIKYTMSNNDGQGNRQKVAMEDSQEFHDGDDGVANDNFHDELSDNGDVTSNSNGHEFELT